MVATFLGSQCVNVESKPAFQMKSVNVSVTFIFIYLLGIISILFIHLSQRYEIL